MKTVNRHPKSSAGIENGPLTQAQPKMGRAPRRGGRQGAALVEFGMSSVVMLMMMLVTFDVGIYANAFISIQNASRVAALRNSGGLESVDDQAAACTMAIAELRGLPGIGPSFTSDCTSGALVVTSVRCDSDSPCASGDPEPSVAVEVAYTLPGLFHLPNVGPGVISRITEAKVRAVP